MKLSHTILILTALLLNACGNSESKDLNSVENPENLNTIKGIGYAITDGCHSDNKQMNKNFKQKFEAFMTAPASEELFRVLLELDWYRAISFSHSGGFSGNVTFYDTQEREVMRSESQDTNSYCNGEDFSKGLVTKMTAQEESELIDRLSSLEIKAYDDIELPVCTDDQLYFPTSSVQFYSRQNEIHHIVDLTESDCKKVTDQTVHGYIHNPEPSATQCSNIIDVVYLCDAHNIVEEKTICEGGDVNSWLGFGFQREQCE